MLGCAVRDAFVYPIRRTASRKSDSKQQANDTDESEISHGGPPAKMKTNP
jgi:hypothetical protein